MVGRRTAPDDRRLSEGGRTGRDPALFLVLFLLALGARLTVFAVNSHREQPHFTVPDSGSYIQAAASLLEHRAFLDEQGNPSWARVPGYPLLLALSFGLRLASPEKPGGAVLVDILLGSLVVAMASGLAAWMAGRPAAISAGILLALEPSSIAHSNVIQSEGLYTLCLTLAIWAWWRWLSRPGVASLLFASLFVGLLPLIRPIGLLLPAVLLPVVVWVTWRNRHRAALAALFVLVCCLPGAAWRARNYHALGSAEIHYTAPWAKAIFAHSVEEMAGKRAGPSPHLQPWEFGFGRDQRLTAPEVTRIQEAYFLSTLRAHPVAAAKRALLNALFLIGVPDHQLSVLILEQVPPVIEGSVLARLRWMIEVGPLGLLIAAGMAVSLGGLAAIPVIALRARRWGFERKSLFVTMVFVVLYHIALSSLVGYQGERYRVPIIPLLAVLLAIACFEGVQAKRGSE